MFYFLTTYSFSNERPVVGPFKTKDECWEAMKKDAEEEYRINAIENDRNDDPLEVDFDEGTIVLTGYSFGGQDTTTWAIINVPSEISEKKLEDILKVLKNSGLAAEQVQDTFKKICDILS